ncbi:hypothetical protein MBELCI_2755 [Limimaricola cinnabarinus LL-001]|uniref:Uncharacterized protein n=1 Tax=Limimaricola cinnabarinus LL-001 TaxID=1337093 RepID=U3APN8_9RHOB|nr:hypothetical protein MBELCI_2755 [Limimaricola cinnabarinus LL-001]
MFLAPPQGRGAAQIVAVIDMGDLSARPRGPARKAIAPPSVA